MQICPLHHQKDLTFQIVFSLWRHLSSLAWFLQCTTGAISLHNQALPNDPKCSCVHHLNLLKRTLYLQCLGSPYLKLWHLATSFSPSYSHHYKWWSLHPATQTRSWTSALWFDVGRQAVNFAPSNTRRLLTVLPLHFRNPYFTFDKSKSLKKMLSNGTPLLLWVSDLLALCLTNKVFWIKASAKWLSVNIECLTCCRQESRNSPV